MPTPAHVLAQADTQQVSFLRARQYIGHRVRARALVRLNSEIAEGCTGSVAFVVAPHQGGVWIAVAWDFSSNA
jgi:hypothetical protein